MNKFLIFTLLIVSFCAACSSSTSGSESTPNPGMPDSIKQQIKTHVESGQALDWTISTGGTGSFAKYNGGVIKLYDRKTFLTTYIIVPAEWAMEAEEYVKTITK